MKLVGACGHCHRTVFEHDDRVYAIQGYERVRHGGGQNHVLRKQRVDGYVWHYRCWESAVRRRDGLGIQEALV
jgi:hypothetical protein